MNFLKTKKTFIVFTLLILLCFTSVKFVQGQEYDFLDTIMPGVSYEWQVTKLSITGSASTSFLDFGNETLTVGDKFSINVTRDINNITAGDPSQLLNDSITWADFYLNGVYKSNDTDDIGLLELDWMSWYDGEHFFLQPITYTNETDTYNYFEIMQNNFEQIEADIKSEINQKNYHENSHMIIKQSSRLTSKTWTIKYQTKLIYKEEDFTGPGGWSKDDDDVDRIIEIRFNVETGLVTYLSYYYNSHSVSEIDGLQTIDDDIIDLVIESTMLPTGAPFSWSFAIIGVFILGVIVYIKRRK